MLCYDVVQEPDQIFVNRNIVMVCDDCLENPNEFSSPKRKQPNFIQRTIDPQNPILLLSNTVLTVPTPPKKVNQTVKQNQNMQAVIEPLVRKIDTNTVTITGLKVYVDTMNNTISQQNTSVQESIKTNLENISSIKETLTLTPNLADSVRHLTKKNSYANVLKRAKIGVNGNETPRSSTKSGTPRNQSVLAGTSNNIIGKPPSPKLARPNDRKKVEQKPEKAVWISRLHRDVTEEQMVDYIKDSIGIAQTEQFQVRKLVKKDQEIATYSFVSFSVACSTEIFNTLLDAQKWPSYCQIREFDLNQKTSTGVKLPVENATANRERSAENGEVTNPVPKNVEVPENVNMETQPVQ